MTRVVITGLGSVCALGAGVDALWNGLVAGTSALGPITRLDASGFACKLAGEVPPAFAAKDVVPKSYRKAVKVMARDTELAVGAAKFAALDAGIVTRANAEDSDPSPPLTYAAERMGCHIGAGLIASEADEITMAFSSARSEAGGGSGFDLHKWGGAGGGGMENLTPLWLLKYLPNMLACHVTIIHGTEAPSNTITCAEASGILSIGESSRVIQRGAADMCFSGGAESKINVMGLLRQDLAKRLAATGEATDGSAFVRPYDEGAPPTAGGITGEGGGILILESMQTAAKRGARMYAEIVGFGGGQSDPWYKAGRDDEGYRYAILNALDDAKIGPEAIDAIVPLACGVGVMDRAEAGALAAVFGERLAKIPLVTIGANIGNCMAGAGGLQVAVAAKCLKEQMLPARLHAGRPEKGLDAGPVAARKAALKYVLVCTGSLGGQNAAAVLKAVG